MKTPLVSIIIPTYNRADLIGETLDSIMGQTYQNWECIVVDDGSTDNTNAVMELYLEKDQRFHYYHRPKEHLPGGNGARNYGFKISKGDYIQWFDSDDIMLPTHLQVKINVLEKNANAQFTVSRSVDFEGQDTFKVLKYDQNQNEGLTLENFIKGKVYWRTIDFLIRKDRIGAVLFNEKLRSGQETNFFLMLLGSQNIRGIYIGKTLTKRRKHVASIQQRIKKNKKRANRSKFCSWVSAYYSIHHKISLKDNVLFLNKIIMMVYVLKAANVSPTDFIKLFFYICNYKSIDKGLAFFVAVTSNMLFKRGFSIINYARS